MGKHLRLFEHQFHPAAFTGTGGKGLTAHAILSSRIAVKMVRERAERQWENRLPTMRSQAAARSVCVPVSELGPAALNCTVTTSPIAWSPIR